jgi:hypothetical protein
MEVISHRGYWKKLEERNTNIAFERSFNLGFGTETDLRDYNGEIVISHDIANSSNTLFSDFLEIHKNAIQKNLPLALNIKSDGLQKQVKKILFDSQIENYFLFDMSIPDLKVSIESDLNTFSRLSEYEKELPFYEKVKGIWLDAFVNTWYTKDILTTHLKNKKTICIVSAELHKRNHIEHWNTLKNFGIQNMENMILCTDLPEEATQFFKI